MQMRLKEEEAKLKEMEAAEKQAKQENSSDSFVSEELSEDSAGDSFISSSSKTASKDEDAEKQEGNIRRGCKRKTEHGGGRRDKEDMRNEACPGERGGNSKRQVIEEQKQTEEG